MTVSFSQAAISFRDVRLLKDEESRDLSKLVREALRLYSEGREVLCQQHPERPRSHKSRPWEN